MKAWWHRSKDEIIKQLESDLPNATQYERALGKKLSMYEIRNLKKKKIIK